MQIISAFGVPIAIISIAFAFLGVIVFVARNYLRCPPNEVLVLFGRKHSIVVEGASVTRGYRLITGGAAFKLPLLEEAQRLSLAVFQIAVQIARAPNKDGVPVTVNAIANVRLSSDQALLGAAVEQFLGKTPEQIQSIIHRTLEGIVRQLVGTLSIEEMVRDREKISKQVIEVTGSELAKLGVKCENFVFTEVADEKGYIEALGQKRTAEVKRDADIGKAEAERDAMLKSSVAKKEGEKARLDNEALIAEAQRDLTVKQAKFLAETQAEQARAALAGEIAKADREKELVTKKTDVERTRVEAETTVAEKQAALTEQQLESTIVKKAEADKKATVIAAEAAKQAAITQAEGQAKAAASLATAAEEQAKATKSAAGAEKERLTLIGEGQAAAEAALVRERGKADGEAIAARLGAEADGIDKKNKALAQMSEGARLILVLDRMPQIIEQGGEALAKALTPAFQGVGAGLAAVDRIEIVDFGGGGDGAAGGTAAERFALSVPRIVLKLLTEGRTLGVDLEPLLAKVGVLAKKKDGAAGADPRDPA